MRRWINMAKYIQMHMDTKKVTPKQSECYINRTKYQEKQIDN